jgi:hypothetical protein
MAPALHFACVWLKGPKRDEFFIPASPGMGPLRYAKWLTRGELFDGLQAGAQFQVAAEKRRKELSLLHREPTDA